ncbi:MAG: thermostable hemolysin [Xanthomonadales bacterium]
MRHNQPIGTSATDARAAQRLARLLTPAPAFRAFLPESTERDRVERYIAERFQHVHGAEIHDFMPVLLTMGCPGTITAATGVRAAARQPLFLEHYLDAPVEQAVSRVARAPVARSGIVEIGNLVASRGGASYLLFMVLTAMLERAGFDRVVFTATPQVRRALAHLGLTVHPICDADPTRLPRHAIDDWGRYYANAPQVVTGNIAQAMNALRRRPLHAGALALFRRAIDDHAGVIGSGSHRRGTHRITA